MYGSMLTDALPDVAVQDTARDVRELRASFETGATLDLATRRRLLRQLQTLMTEGAAAMREALWKDLRKHPVEALTCELSVTNAEIQEHLDYLSDWAAPQRTSTNLVNLPGLTYLQYEPLGVVCVIGTWNYPVNLLFTPLASALAAGNCVLLRLPGDDTTRFLNNVFISLLDKYMDKRFVRYVYGGVDETKAMLTQRFDLIFATGGTFLGKIVARAAAEHLTPTVLEMGGKNPAIVDESADLAISAKRIAWGAFTNAGQTCVRPDYVLVDERVGSKFVLALDAAVTKFYGEDAQKSDSYCRVINQRAMMRLKAVVAADKARITRGGVVDERDLYVAPTLLNFELDREGFAASAAMQQELFGPLLPIVYYPAGDLQWAIDFIRTREKSLSLYLFSTSSRNKAKIAKHTCSGSFVVNDCMVQLTNTSMPFGGVGGSGMGSYHGHHGFKAFSHLKPILYKSTMLDIPQRYAPFSDSSFRFFTVLMYPFSRLHFRVLGITVAVFVAIGLAFIAKSLLASE